MKTSVPHPCPAWAAQLAAAQSNDLSPEERAALEAHLASCETCRAAQERYAEMDAAILRLPAPALPDLPAKLLAQWQAEDRAGRRSGMVRPLRLRGRAVPGAAPTLPNGPSAPPRRPLSLLTAAAAVLLVALLTTALIASRLHSGGPPTGNPTPQNTTAPTVVTNQPTTTAPTATSTPKSYPVQVFFSRHPESDSDPNAVFAVQRIAPNLGVATFALKQLFLGPTADEQAQGYYSDFVGNLGAVNYCADSSNDFVLSLDHRGTTPETGTATVILCRQVSVPGDLSGFRMQAMITRTLLQFPTNKRVVILNSQGDCFNDLRGDNACLQG
jgi:hypothetical protein